MREKEIRTPHLNLLLCKAVITDEGKLFLELKNGKRMERLPMEEFLVEINNFTQGQIPKLHMVQSDLDELVCIMQEEAGVNTLISDCVLILALFFGGKT